MADDAEKDKLVNLIKQSKYGDRKQEIVMIGVGLKKAQPVCKYLCTYILLP